MYKFKCHECDCTVHGEYIPIMGDMWCIDCAEDFLSDELAELKIKNRKSWIEKVADVLGYQILEV